MTKEYLEALERLAMPDELHIKECKRLGIGLTEDYDILKQYFEAIENININEVLKYVNGKIADLEDDLQHYTMVEKDKCKEFYIREDLKQFTNIKQALLKSQVNEKENAYIEKIITMMKQKDCVLRYIESEDCFAVKTILSDGWYKLTPEFVENNVREEIKPLPLIEKNKQLKAENAEYKEVLDIIKEKRVNVANLIDWFNNSQNTSYEGYLSDYYQEGWFIHFKDNDDVDIMYQLTQKEFDTLKRYFR